MEKKFKCAGYQYVYDPTHENKPDGIWNRTGSGWSRSDGEPVSNDSGKSNADRKPLEAPEHEKSTVEQPDQKPGENAVVLEEEGESSEQQEQRPEEKESATTPPAATPSPANSDSDAGTDEEDDPDGLFSPENEDGFDTGGDNGDEEQPAEENGDEVNDDELDALEEKYFGDDGANDDDPDAPADDENANSESGEEEQPSEEQPSENNEAGSDDDLDALEEKYFGDDASADDSGNEDGESAGDSQPEESSVPQKEPETPEGDQLDDSAKAAYTDPAQFNGRVEKMNSFIDTFDGGEGKENDVTFKAVAANLDWSNIDDVRAFRDHCKRQNVEGADETIAFLYHQHQADEQKFEEILDKMN